MDSVNVYNSLTDFLAIDYVLGWMEGFIFKNIESKKRLRAYSKNCHDINGHCRSAIRLSNREWKLHA